MRVLGFQTVAHTSTFPWNPERYLDGIVLHSRGGHSHRPLVRPKVEVNAIEVVVLNDTVNLLFPVSAPALGSRAHERGF